MRTLTPKQAASLRLTGIGARYWTQMLDDEGPVGRALQVWLQTAFQAHHRAGRGLIFVGGNAAEDVAHVAATEVHLHGFGVRVMDLLDFEQEYPAEVHDRLLVLPNFWTPEMVAGHSPELRARVTQYLLWRLRDQRPVWVHSEQPFTQPLDGWSPRLLSRLWAEAHVVSVHPGALV